MRLFEVQAVVASAGRQEAEFKSSYCLIATVCSPKTSARCGYAPTGILGRI